MRTALLTPPAHLLSSYPPFLEHPISSSGLFLRSCVANAALPAAPPHRYPPCPSCPVLGLRSLFGQPLGFMHPPRICKVLLPPSLALPSLPLLPRFQPIIPPWAAPPCSSTEYFSHLPSPFPNRPPLRFPLPILYIALRCLSPPVMAAQRHNPDEEMALADDELQLDAKNSNWKTFLTTRSLQALLLTAPLLRRSCALREAVLPPSLAHPAQHPTL
ncbi:unnamed protein product [Closterium sp. Naga37s-1]|nr:unnamed protein product [Closterium sp. Naga37s-1]